MEASYTLPLTNVSQLYHASITYLERVRLRLLVSFRCRRCFRRCFNIISTLLRHKQVARHAGMLNFDDASLLLDKLRQSAEGYVQEGVVRVESCMA